MAGRHASGHLGGTGREESEYPSVGSLFSGIGGIDLGLERAGMRVLWQCEADEYRRAVLRERFPGVPCYEDVRTVGGGAKRDRESEPAAEMPLRKGLERPEQSLGTVDLVCGGFPCQDLSVAGRRRGLAGERSGLFFEFARVADALLPDGGFVLIENVPGLLSSHGGRDFAVLFATLAELGFHDLAWRVLDSRYFGVPQRRRRVFILGRRARGRSCAEILLEPESGGGDSQAGREARETASRPSESGSGSGHYYVEDFEDGTLTSSEGRIDRHPLVAAPLSHGSNPNSNMAGRRREDDVNLVTAFHMLQDPVSEEDSTPAWGKGNKNGTASLGIAQGSAVRRLTPTECERLQGFPDGWTAYGKRLEDQESVKAPDSRRYAALGDAVTVNVAEWIGRRIMAHIEVKP